MVTALKELQFATKAQLDTAIQDLSLGIVKWANSNLQERIALLKKTHASIATASEDWAKAAILAKGTPQGSLEGEEWMSGPYATLNGFTAVIESLEKLAQGKSPLDGVKASKAPNGRIKFRMLPSNFYEFNLFHGFRGDLWLEPGVSEAEARAKAGLGAKRLGENGGVGLVLGAGNISAIGPLDMLYELIAHNRAVVLKLNPTFGSLLDIYKQAFAPLIEANLLRVVNGDAETGAYLTDHIGIKHVHITGSGITHDKIVWGSTTTKVGRPILNKPITSELGGVSPIIIVPGKWSKADLRYQAENVVTQRTHNGGHNCIAGQAIILSKDWEQKDEFLTIVAEEFEKAAKRPTWYPGSEAKLAAAQAAYPNAKRIKDTLLIEVNEQTSQDLLTTEYFAPVLGHIALEGTDVDFFRNAVAFANNELDGSLGASIIVAPRDRKAMGQAFENTLADLRYGTIGINVWSAIGFLVPSLSWGAFAGNTLENVGSGIGIVHNSHLVERTERSVIWGPFRPFPRSFINGEIALSPKPAWFVTARSAKDTAQKLTQFSVKPSVTKMLKIFVDAFKA
ncbi:aldehyde dehydrogenase family protein [Acinetobacter sp. YK3]|uniref:aldehyde dehydrogenase family protein n=1 Tax=Acinetobacter sp. YK3 TaxID=1860097 RepID=UPI00084C35CB|nr:aldehyde dehydrogenase family protein [Acinetobacter sp. YK3]OEC89662.1 aldehyde dehydrogenase [Acinetobacter sp. YK3]